MKTVLSCELPVIRYTVFAEMAWMQRRPELGLLCQTVKSKGRRFSPATIQAALPGLSDAGAQNVLSWCKMLGLADSGGALTRLGEDVAQSDEAPIPEQGVYGLWIVEHPLVGRRVLAAERLMPRKDQRFESIQPIPVEPDRGKSFRSVVNKNERFVVRDLPTNHGQLGCVVGNTQGVCRLEWTVDFDAESNHWRFDGMLDVTESNGNKSSNSLKPMAHEPEMDDLDVWKLVEFWGKGSLLEFGRWNADERRLAVPYSGLSAAEMDQFGKTFNLSRVDVPGRGSYRDVKLEHVPIGPGTREDAQRWAMNRFERNLVQKTAYRSRAEVRCGFVEQVESTPLEKFSPVLPAHGELLKAYEKDPAAYWSLAAPVDLAPKEVGPEELAALQIGRFTPAVASPTSEGIVRVPYRCGWTMKQLVDKLFAGYVPRKVLLCDRYVCGVDNLKMLELFVQAIRAVSTAIGIEVWTDDDRTDFKQIQAITGTAPRKLKDVFGRNVPHDRYVIVQENPGQGCGWQLSNSPLHARADLPGANSGTPLRWKDLSGTRVLPDELEPSLRQWLTGGAR